MNKGSTGKGAVLDTGIATLFGWWVFTFFCWFVLGVMGITILWLLHAPWINVGMFLVSEDTPMPVANLVFNIPVIGGWLSNQMSQPVAWVATVAMTAVNTIQVMAMLQQSGYITMKNDFWVTVLSCFAIGSWLIELGVALTEYNVYDGGMAGFMADLPIPTLSYFNWGEVGSVIVLMFLFEFSIYFGAIVILALKHNKGISQAKARAKTRA